MTKEKRPELKLRGQPSEILKRLRPAFKTHVRPHTENQKGERLGGRSILNAQWNHRLSRDVDVYLRLTTKEDGRAILDRAARACNGYRVEHPNFPRIEFERDKDNHIDINLDPPKPKRGERMTVVDGEETPVLSNAQIMTGKLKGRGMTSPGRDVFDTAVCRIADPEALEVAVNSLDDITLNGILTVYKITREQYAKEASELNGVAEGLKPVQKDPVGYANDAILRSRYERLSIRTVEGTAEIETRTPGQPARVRKYSDAEQLVDGMERHGINAFLEAQYRSAEAVLNDTVDNLWKNHSTTIIVVKPEKPEHELLEMPRVEWSPPGNKRNEGDNGGERRKATSEPKKKYLPPDLESATKPAVPKQPSAKDPDAAKKTEKTPSRDDYDRD